MSGYWVSNDRAPIPIEQKDETVALILKEAKKLHASDLGYSAQLISIIESVVSSRAKFYRWSNEDARQLQVELAGESVVSLSKLLRRPEILEAQKIHSSLEQARGIMREEDIILRGFTPVSAADARVTPSEMLGVIQGLGRLASSLGAPRAADGWFAREISVTLKGPRADKVGEYKKRFRPFMAPFVEIQSIDPRNPLEPTMLDTLQRNRSGVRHAVLSLYRSLPGVEQHDDSQVRPIFGLSAPVLGRVNLLGTELGGFRQYADRLQTIPATRFTEVRAALTANHRAYLASNYNTAEPELRRAFDDLEPLDKRRNIPSMLGALYGLTQANRLVVEVLKNGILLEDGAPSEAASDLRLHLVSSAADAMSQSDFTTANSTFGLAVADEIGLLLAHRNQAAARLPEIHAAVSKAVLAAGDAFLGDERQKAAPRIALTNFGELMQALRPEAGVEADEWERRGAELLGRARVEDIAEICREEFLIQGLPDAKDVVAQLKAEIDPQDHFYKSIDKLAPRNTGEKGLNDDDRKLLSNLLYLTNATWKSGQVHRAIAEGDLTRVNPLERGRVFNPYDICVTAAGSPLKSFFCVAKDLLVLRGVAV